MRLPRHATWFVPENAVLGKANARTARTQEPSDLGAMLTNDDLHLAPQGALARQRGGYCNLEMTPSRL